MKSLIRRAVGTLLALLVVGAPSTAQAAPADTESLAWFEDHWIDLTVDWEDATACDVSPAGIVCFRSEKELDVALLRAAASVAIGPLSLVCGSSVRLYDGLSYGGTVLNLNVRFTILNLSTYGFDNVTTSYKVGGCDAEFYSGANLGGSAYPGNTAAFAQSPAMTTGWNNVASSVYIF